MDGCQTQALYGNTKQLFGGQYIITFLPSFIEFSLTTRCSEVCRMVFWLHSEMVAIIRVDDRAISTHSLFDVVTGVRTLSLTPLTNFKYLECSHQPQSPLHIRSPEHNHLQTAVCSFSSQVSPVPDWNSFLEITGVASKETQLRTCKVTKKERTKCSRNSISSITPSVGIYVMMNSKYQFDTT